MKKILRFISPHGVVSRGRYALLGTALFFIKHNLDRFLAAFVFERRWSLTSYWKPSELFTLPALPEAEIGFYVTMLTVALAFIWIGVTLTLRRLRDANLPLGLVVFFFAPFVNLFFFLSLCLFPSKEGMESASSSPTGLRRMLDRAIPESQVGSAGGRDRCDFDVRVCGDAI